MVLIDTSMWIEALRKTGQSDVRQRVDDLMATDEAVWCDIILLELWNGARGQQELAALHYLQSVILSLAIDDSVWRQSFELVRKARSKGLTVPAADILIVACAQRHGVTLEHRDSHLERLVDLQ